jgi:hypothetical protein
MLSDSTWRLFALQCPIEPTDPDEVITEAEAQEAVAMFEAAGVDVAAWAAEIRSKVAATLNAHRVRRG